MPPVQMISISKNKENSEDNVAAQPACANKQSEQNDSRKNMDNWKNNCNPPKLNQNEVETLFQTFLNDLKDEDCKECIEIFRKQKISGKMLVGASENEKKMKRMKEALNFVLGYEDLFDEMVDFIRKRQLELNRKIKEEDTENNKTLPKSEEGSSRKRKLPASSETTEAIGIEGSNDKEANVTLKKIKVKEPKTAQRSIGAKIDATGNTVITVEDVNVG